MKIINSFDALISEVSERELRELVGGQYFKPVIDGSFLVDRSDDNRLGLKKCYFDNQAISRSCISIGPTNKQKI